MAAAVVDSLLPAAMAAILDETGLLVPPADADGVLLLIEEDPADVPRELLLPPALLFELTNCPAKVGKTAEAPADAEPVVDGVPEAAEAAVAATGAVDPSSGTDAEAPVEPVLM